MKNLKIKMLLSTITVAAMLTACGKADIQLNNETVTVELGTELSGEITDYITIDDEAELENVTLDVSGVNTGAVGSYTASVTYDDEIFNINVNVVDTTAPDITTTDKEAEVGDIIKVSDVAKASDLADVELKFEDGSDIWTADAAGNYSLVVVAVDASGNESMASVKVVVAEPEPEVVEEPEEEEIVTGTVDKNDNGSASNTSNSGKTNTKDKNNASNGNSNGGSTQAQNPEPSAPQQSAPQAQAPANNPEPDPAPAPAPQPAQPSSGATVTQGTQEDMKYAQDMMQDVIDNPYSGPVDIVLPDDFGDER